jgi:RNA polymerase sigma-70 factor (ECF subfamily)
MSCQIDQQLLARAIGGDRAAAGELLLEASGMLTAYVARELPKPIAHLVSVEDVLQETFHSAFATIGDLQAADEAAFLAWLRTIAKHRMLDTLRRHKRKRRGGDRQQVAAHSSTDSVLNLFDALCGDATPSRRVSRNEALSCMHVALAELPEDYRQAVRLRFLEDKSYKEVAEAMGRSEGAVHGLITRAKDRLRDLLGRASAYLSSR